MEQEQLERCLGMREVLALLSVSRSTLNRWIREGAFPRPVKLGKRAVRWRRADIEHWLKELQST